MEEFATIRNEWALLRTNEEKEAFRKKRKEFVAECENVSVISASSTAYNSNMPTSTLHFSPAGDIVTMNDYIVISWRSEQCASKRMSPQLTLIRRDLKTLIA